MTGAQSAEFHGSFSGYERDHAYLQVGGGERLYDGAYCLGIDFDTDGRSAVPVDVDGDGDLDLAILSLQRLYLLENRAPRRTFARLVLNAVEGEPHALGARVRIEAGGRAQAGHVKLTDGFQSQVPRELHFGLGDAERIDRVRVTWPSGRVDEWTGLPVSKRLVLTEGSEEFVEQEIPAWPADARPRRGPSPTPLFVAERLDGEKEQLGAPGRPTVVNFWAPWCAPCQHELPELARLAKERDVRVCGVSVEREDLDSVRAAITKHSLEYPQFVAGDALLEAFFGDGGEAALPATFIYDDEGQLQRVFRRPVGFDELDALTRAIEVDHVYVQDLLRRGRLELEVGRLQEALAIFREALRADPENAEAYNDIGKVFVIAGEVEKSERFFEQAVELNPELDQALYNLGVARLDQDRPKEAVAPIQAALKLRGEDYETLLTLGTVAARMADFQLAYDAFDRATRVDRTATALILKGRALTDLGRKEEARAAFEQALEIVPDYPPAKEALRGLDKR